MAPTAIDINQFMLQPEPGIWETVRALGSGGFGQVTLEKRADGKQRALKRIEGTIAQNSRLKRELEILVQVKKCPDLCVQSLGWYESSEDTYIALEYMDKGDLGKYLAANGPQTEADTKEITRQLLQGLEFLHKNNICHRDMKPENVLMASISPLRVKLTDFGASKITSKNTALRTRTGTMRYMAPELMGLLPPGRTLKNGEYTNAVDMWSLGFLTYQVFTSKTPFMKEQSLSEIYTDTYTYTVDDEEPTQPQEDITLMSEYCCGETSLPIEDLKDRRLSDEGIQFIKDLLLPFPQDRPSAADAANSAWLSVPSEAMNRAEVTRVQFQTLGVHLSRQIVEKMIQHLENSQGKAGPQLKKMEVPELPSSVRQSAAAIMHAAGEKSYTNILDIMSYLIEPKKGCFDFRINGKTTLELAAIEGHIEVAKILLENGANVNAAPSPNVLNGRTALQAAAEGGNLEMVKFLLDNRANINAKPSSQRGRGALQAAVENSHYEMVVLLLQEGANVNLPPAIMKGATALQFAAEKGSLKLVELLLSKGAKVNAAGSDSCGRTALQAAAGNGHLNIVEILLKKGAKVNDEPAEDNGRTALQAAAENGHLDIVKLLLKMGANVNAEPGEDNGVTALAAATRGKHAEVVKVLRAAGAKT